MGLAAAYDASQNEAHSVSWSQGRRPRQGEGVTQEEGCDGQRAQRARGKEGCHG